MALQEYMWQNITHKDLLKCIKWCQNKFNLRDWEITLDTNTDYPKNDDTYIEADAHDLGESFIRTNYLKAVIWIPLETHKKMNENTYETCIHEMLHVLTIGVGKIEIEESEIISYRLESLLYRLFCIDNNIKIPDVLENRII